MVSSEKDRLFHNPSTLKISEIFYSLQGEGTNIGVPSIFIRTALCNLQCSWCDTKYTWDWNQYDYNIEVRELHFSDIEDLLSRFSAQNLVITGGEPLLQQESLARLLEGIRFSRFVTEIETNGTIKPIPQLEKCVNQWNVSPKLSNSNNRLAIDHPASIEYFTNSKKSFFKFVVQNTIDVDEVKQFVDRYGISNDKVILMPQAQTKDELMERSGFVAEEAKKNCYRFSTRLQVSLWSRKRGV